MSKLLKRCTYISTLHFTVSMNIFTQKLNPMTGRSEWEVENEDYDYHQEVARSSFADMLHDSERNRKYEKALKIAIERIHSLGKQALVLDIGTGTGLLSMIALRNGADKVTACEAFLPMSQCAVEVIRENGFENKVKVIPKRSTELTVGPDGDLTERANVLVTEVFDTELIGEGALSTFSHAHKKLLEKDCIVIPQSATIYAQIVCSPFIQSFNKLKDIKSLVKVPDSIKNCLGSAAVHDLQMSQLPLENLTTIVSPQPVLRFDFSGRTPTIFQRSTLTTIKAEQSGSAHAVLTWWDLQMDINNEVLLSCAPFWAHPLKLDLPWRDHWMQAIYYLPKEVEVKQNEELHLVSCHDEFSLWFNVRKDLRLSDVDYLRPICECGLHVALSRTRIAQLNDGERVGKYLRVLRENVGSDSIVLVLSHGCYVGLSAVRFNAKKVFVLETNTLLRRILKDFIVFNRFDNVEIIENTDDLSKLSRLSDVSVVFAEPYFTSSILPWDNLLFAYLLKDIKPFLSDSTKIFPSKAIFKAIPLRFKHLHKIRSPLGMCEGFKMKAFDKLIEESSGISDSNVEAQPLWEYPGTALSPIEEICSLDIVKFSNDIEVTGKFYIESGEKCNGVALWVDWIFDDASKIIITTGPIAEPKVGGIVKWDCNTRQGVCLFQEKEVKELHYCFSFNCRDGVINFSCK